MLGLLSLWVEDSEIPNTPCVQILLSDKTTRSATAGEASIEAAHEAAKVILNNNLSPDLAAIWADITWDKLVAWKKERERRRGLLEIFRKLFSKFVAWKVRQELGRGGV